MTKCLITEASTLIRHSGVKKIKSIFFGGGTPSLASVQTLSEIINCVKKSTNLLTDAEISLEASPEALTQTYLREINSAGINRLSVGVQAFSDTELKSLNRSHNVEEAVRSIQLANSIFPGKVSIDLLFGRPGQTLKQWQHELHMAKDLNVDHVSLYQLTLERGTPLFKAAKLGSVTLPNEEATAEMYETAIQELKLSSHARYEVSNFARNGAESKHNQAYWTGTQFIGVGPGSHGRFAPRYLGLNQREARVQVPDPRNWMEAVERHGHATAKRTQLSKVDLLQEILATGLRMATGITNQTWECFSEGQSIENSFQGCKQLREFEEQGWVFRDGRVLKATEKGLSVLDSLLPPLFSHIQHTAEAKEIPFQ